MHRLRFTILIAGICAVALILCQSVAPEDNRVLRALNKLDQLTNEENTQKASELSKETLQTIRDIRGGTDEFYAELFNALLITMCDLKVKDPNALNNPRQRFVPKDSEFAYKGDDGQCLRVAKPEDEVKRAYALGKCEVKPNCYWDDFLPGDDYRATMYDIEARKPPAEGTLTLDGSKDVMENWAKGFGIFVTPGIILAVLSLLTMILFLVCRCCCNKCGGRNPRPGGYSCKQKLIPIIIFFLFSAGVGVCAILAFVFNQQVTGAVSDVFTHTGDTLNDTNTWIRAARAPLVSIKDQVLKSVGDIRTELAGTTFIDNGLNSLTGKLNDFGAHTSNVKLPRGCKVGTDPFCTPCGVCTTISDDVKKSADQMDKAASSGIASLGKIRKDLNVQLVDIAETIKTMVENKVAVTENIIASVDDSRQTVTEIEAQWDGQDQVRMFGVLAMFALAIAVIAIGLVGIILGLTPLRSLACIMHIAYLIGFISLFIGFLIGAIMIAFSVLLGDMCEITKIMQQDWAPVLGKEPATGLNACFQNESLLVAFKLESSLKFADSLDFPVLEVSSMLDFKEFDKFAGSIDNTQSDTFKLDKTLMKSYVDSLNALTGKNVGACKPNDNSYAVDNVLRPWIANGDPEPVNKDPKLYMQDRYDKNGGNKVNVAGCPDLTICSQGQNPCTYKEGVMEVWRNISTLRRIELDSAKFVQDMKKNMTNVITYVDTFKGNVTNMDKSIAKIKKELTSSLFKNVADFKKAMYCTFLAEGFDEIMGAMCVDLMPALLMISLSIFLMSVFMIPVNITLIILCKRLRASGNGEVIPGETEFK